MFKAEDEGNKNEQDKQNNIQMSKKIFMNSLYGSLCNPYFRYSDYDNAEAVTFTGQLALKWVLTRFNKFINNLLKTEK